MTNIIKPMVLDETFGAKLDAVNENLHKIALGVGGDYTKPTKWEEIQIMCRNGKIKQALEVGEEYDVKIDGVNYPFCVMGFIDDNKTGSLKIKNDNLLTGVIFQSKDILYNLQFDAREAFYAVKEAEMPAGNYCFKVTQHSWCTGDIGKTFYFTLANPVPVGGQLVFTHSAQSTIAGSTINVFNSPTTFTPNQTAVASETAIDGATNLGDLSNAINGGLNSCQRAFYGNNRWKDSAIRQQLNSAEVAGNVWNPQNIWDREPSWRTSQKGFLNGLDADLQKYIVDVEVDTYRNTVCDGGGLDTTTDRIFLAGRNECYFPQEGADNGVAWDFYKDGSTSATPTNNADPIRIKKQQSGTPYYWWLRSPNVGGAGYVRFVGTAGASDYSIAVYSGGVAPAFVIA